MTPERKLRRLTVLNRRRWPDFAQVPDIRLCGRWLERAGFLPGSRLAVAVELGRLVVTVVAPPGPRRRPRAPEDDGMPWYARR